MLKVSVSAYIISSISYSFIFGATQVYLLFFMFVFHCQVYSEAYTCPCVRYHPYETCFVAQSNANYIAIFSARPPFKLDKYKRYEGHGVWGFPIKCNFSSDGRELASGSSDGSIYFYDYRSSKFLRKISAFGEACIDVAFHPLIPNVIACCSWAGEVCVFE